MKEQSNFGEVNKSSLSKESFNHKIEENNPRMNEDFVYKFENNKTGYDQNLTGHEYNNESHITGTHIEEQKFDSQDIQKVINTASTSASTSSVAATTSGAVSTIATVATTAVVVVVGGGMVVAGQNYEPPAIVEFNQLEADKNTIKFTLSLGNNQEKIDSGEETGDCDVVIELTCESYEDVNEIKEIKSFGKYSGEFTDLNYSTEYTINVYQRAFLDLDTTYLMDPIKISTGEKEKEPEPIVVELDAPTDVYVEQDREEIYHISFSEVENATFYTVYYVDEETGEDVATEIISGPGVALEAVTTLPEGVYLVYVTANTEDKESDRSESYGVVSVYIPIELLPPENIIIEVDDNIYTIYFDQVSDATGYKVYYVNAVNDEDVGNESVDGTASILSRPSSLEEGRYYVYMTSLRDDEESERSTSFAEIEKEPSSLEAPTGVSISEAATTSGYIISFSEVTGATSYKVYYVDDSTAEDIDSETISGSGALLTKISSLPYLTYRIHVTALKDNEESARSSYVIFEKEHDPLDAPDNIEIIDTADGYTVSFDSVREATSYKVYYVNASTGEDDCSEEIGGSGALLTQPSTMPYGTYYVYVSSYRDSDDFESERSTSYATLILERELNNVLYIEKAFDAFGNSRFNISAYYDGDQDGLYNYTLGISDSAVDPDNVDMTRWVEMTSLSSLNGELEPISLSIADSTYYVAIMAFKQVGNPIHRAGGDGEMVLLFQKEVDFTNLTVNEEKPEISLLLEKEVDPLGSTDYYGTLSYDGNPTGLSDIEMKAIEGQINEEEFGQVDWTAVQELESINTSKTHYSNWNVQDDDAMHTVALVAYKNQEETLLGLWEVEFSELDVTSVDTDGIYLQRYVMDTPSTSHTEYRFIYQYSGNDTQYYSNFGISIYDASTYDDAYYGTIPGFNEETKFELFEEADHYATYHIVITADSSKQEDIDDYNEQHPGSQTSDMVYGIEIYEQDIDFSTIKTVNDYEDYDPSPVINGDPLFAIKQSNYDFIAIFIDLEVNDPGSYWSNYKIKFINPNDANEYYESAISYSTFGGRYLSDFSSEDISILKMGSFDYEIRVDSTDPNNSGEYMLVKEGTVDFNRYTPELINGAPKFEQVSSAAALIYSLEIYIENTDDYVDYEVTMEPMSGGQTITITVSSANTTINLEDYIGQISNNETYIVSVNGNTTSGTPEFIFSETIDFSAL